MSIFIGSNELKEAYVGSTEVKEIWVGGTSVWTNVPDINFAPDEWLSGVATDVWEFISGGGGGAPSPSLLGDRVRLYGDLAGTYPAYSWYNNSMRATGIQLEPNTNYQFAVVLANFGVSRLRMYVRTTGGTAIGYRELRSIHTGLQVEPFTTDGSGVVNIELAVNEFSTSGTVSVDVLETYLERV